MKKKLIYLGLTGCILFALCTRLQAQIDSLQAHRYVTRATMYGVGFTNVFDTYLSPQEYKGIDFRVSRELIRMTKLFDGNVSVQNFFQANISYTHNRADNNNTFSGLVNWNYGLHYQFRLTDNFKLLAGGLIDVNGGFVYNLRNTNNPASARAYVNLDASGMAIWHLKIKRYPIGYTKMRFSYLADLQQSNVNNIKTHTYSHVFMVGFVKDLYRIRNKKGTALPSSVRAY